MQSDLSQLSLHLRFFSKRGSINKFLQVWLILDMGLHLLVDMEG